jgi:hypothetical protein
VSRESATALRRTTAMVAKDAGRSNANQDASLQIHRRPDHSYCATECAHGGASQRCKPASCAGLSIRQTKPKISVGPVPHLPIEGPRLKTGEPRFVIDQQRGSAALAQSQASRDQSRDLSRAGRCSRMRRKLHSRGRGLRCAHLSEPRAYHRYREQRAD